MRTQKSTYVIVTDGFWRKSLSAVRSLGSEGFEVCVVGDSIFTTAFWSAFTSKRLICPDVVANPKKFSDVVFSFLKEFDQNNLCILFPMEEATLEWVSSNREKLSKHAAFLIPSQISLDTALSKSKTVKAAEKLAINAPKTYEFSNVHEFVRSIDELGSKGGVDEYVVKPERGSGSQGLIYCDTAVSVDWSKHWAKFGNLLIQERIDMSGVGVGVSLLFDATGDCVASFVHKRLQQYPNTGGPSTSRISIYDENLIAKSIQLMKSLNWQGVAMVEWKYDPETSVYMLMEINPRFWGSLELAVRSGVDFPRLYALAAKREQFDHVHAYEKGVICRWLFPGEILRYLSQKGSKREGFLSFFSGLPRTCEEWNKHDLRGFISSFICPFVSIFRPKYWRFLNR